MEVSRERGEGNKGSVGDGDVPLGGLATLGGGGGGEPWFGLVPVEGW